MNTCSATYGEKTRSEKILAVFSAGAILSAVVFPMVSRCSTKEANRLVFSIVTASSKLSTAKHSTPYR